MFDRMVRTCLLDSFIHPLISKRTTECRRQNLNRRRPCEGERLLPMYLTKLLTI